VRQFTAGRDAWPLRLAVGDAGVLICNEAMFGNLARSRVRDGAEFLILLSNDSWVDDPMYAQHQLQMATMRAIEQRRWVVRASTSGPSAIIDASGRVEVVSDPQTRAALTGTFRRENALSIYSKVGDVFAWACLVGMFLTMAALALSVRRVG